MLLKSVLVCHMLAALAFLFGLLVYIYIYIPSPVASHTVHELPCNLDGRFIVPS